MKRTAIIAAAIVASLTAHAQVEYTLPLTSIQVSVTAEKETFFAGPYAAYAEKLLGLEVRTFDSEKTTLKEMRITPAVRADLSSVFTVDAKALNTCLALNAEGLVAFRDKAEAGEAVWRFRPEERDRFGEKGITSALRTEKKTFYKIVQTDSTFEQIPVEQEIVVKRSLEERAREAADMLLKARSEKFNIATGNTDATFSGEALGAALEYLDKVEKEYLSLFTGYSVKETISRCFEVEPSEATATLPLFRVSDENGLLDSSADEGTIYYIDIQTAPVPAAGEESKPYKGAVVYYRIPAVSSVSIITGDEVVMNASVPVYQLGRIAKYPVK
ncbi:MAG: DUF4831 family protein [Bacteroidales bacterium]|nr:DUF4831 family protein [Bacteroidales bacterium]